MIESPSQHPDQERVRNVINIYAGSKADFRSLTLESWSNDYMKSKETSAESKMNPKSSFISILVKFFKKRTIKFFGSPKGVSTEEKTIHTSTEVKNPE